MQFTMQRTRPAWPAKTKLRMTLDCSRIAKKNVMMSGLFVEGGRQTLLYSCKRQEWERSEKSSKKTNGLLPEGRSQATNLKTQKQTKWIEMHQSEVNICFLRGPLRWLMQQKNPKFLRSLPNAQRNKTNLAVKWNAVEPPCATNSRKRPRPISDRQSKTPKFSQSKPCSWNLL